MRLIMLLQSVKKGLLWILIGLTLIGFAIATALSIKMAGSDEARMSLFYSYGSVILTLLIALGILLILFPTGIISALKRPLKHKG